MLKEFQKSWKYLGKILLIVGYHLSRRSKANKAKHADMEKLPHFCPPSPIQNS
jgi:hypothetical protein